MTQCHLPREAKIKAKIEAAVARFWVLSGAPGVIAGVFAPGLESNRDYWSFGNGTTRAGGTISPDRRTMWQIGSLTKTITATLLALAVQDGRVKLEDPVAAFAPPGAVLPVYLDGNGTVSQIRFVDLGTQTGSLPLDPNNGSAGGYSIQEMYVYLESYALTAPPGSRWNYSNLGFSLLANVLASLDNFDGFSELFEDWKRRSGLPLDEMVITPTANQRERLALGYDATARQAPWRTITWPAFNGSGALYSTLDALMTWLAYNLGREESPFGKLPAITQRVYFDDGSHVMALAWEYFLLPGGAERYLGKDGQTNGFASFLGLMRERDIGVAILCNNSAAIPQTLCNEIMRILTEIDSL